MAIAFVAVGTVLKATTGNLTGVALPVGHVASHVLILRLIAADNATGTMPAGWTQKLAVNNGVACRYEEWWKYDNGAESAPTVTRTGTAVASIAWIEAYSGVDNTLASPYRDAQTQTGAGTATTFTVTAPALTGVISGDFLTVGMGFGVAADTSGAPAFSTIVGWAERVDSSQLAGANAAAGASDNLLASGAAGSVTSTATWNGTLAANWVAAQSALNSTTSTPTPSDAGVLQRGAGPRRLTGPYSRQRQFGVDALPTTAASGTAALALSGDQAVWSEPATASLSLSASAPAAAAATSTAALSLTASAAWIAPPSGASLTLTGAGTWTEPATAALSLTASSVWAEPAAGALSLTASSAWTEPAAGSLTLAASAVWTEPAAGILALTATASGGARDTATAAVTLTGSATWVQPAAGALSLSAAGSGPGQTATAVLTVIGSGTWTVTPTGSLTLAATAAAAAVGSATGSVTLAAGSAAVGGAAGGGALTLAAALAAQARDGALATLTLLATGAAAARQEPNWGGRTTTVGTAAGSTQQLSAAKTSGTTTTGHTGNSGVGATRQEKI